MRKGLPLFWSTATNSAYPLGSGKSAATRSHHARFPRIVAVPNLLHAAVRERCAVVVERARKRCWRIAVHGAKTTRTRRRTDESDAATDRGGPTPLLRVSNHISISLRVRSTVCVSRCTSGTSAAWPVSIETPRYGPRETAALARASASRLPSRPARTTAATASSTTTATTTRATRRRRGAPRVGREARARGAPDARAGGPLQVARSRGRRIRNSCNVLTRRSEGGGRRWVVDIFEFRETRAGSGDADGRCRQGRPA